MPKFLDMLKQANASRQRQSHRVVAGTKRARQLQAQHGGQGETPAAKPGASAKPRRDV